ncbi:MAG: NADP-dependent phosphogluconate dehydrogenase [Nitrososphaerota archaeon]|nr:NADP-dependent phosphogluconate dehydrogenase [Candidatus Calditenuaceae archaeon]MDW8072819.1 NADP-dependent phosphogluconate dehydrogenase [Nitrososphaerota archaeon]
MSLLDVGVYGLGVMGEAFALNLERRGLGVAVYNRTVERTRQFIQGRARGRKIQGFTEVRDFVNSLSRPRTIILFVKAGKPVDDVIEGLVGMLDRGDVLLDCGNSHYKDSDRRFTELASKGIRFLGVGVSGGEEGALRGPSMMFGGDYSAYAEAESTIGRAAAVFEDSRCVGYFGEGGGGHFVKIIHNGIEYAIMEAIAEAYDFLTRGLGLSSGEAGEVFEEWGRGELRSFLVEAASKVARHIDSETGRPLVELIVDEAEQKGTGRWAVEAALELGVSAPTIAAAVDQRTLTTLRSLRRIGPMPERIEGVRNGEAVEAARDALWATTLLSYLQGMGILDAGARTYGFKVAEALRVWRAGCIIRSKIVEELYRELSNAPGEPLAVSLKSNLYGLEESMSGWLRFISLASTLKIPTPAVMSALSYYLSLRAEKLPANLIQAIRDYFGGHMFKRVDREGYHHSDWGRRLE